MKFLYIVIFLTITLFIPHAILNAQGIIKYEYPLNHNMPEWKTLPIEEKNKMLQIPEDKLKNMRTETLIQAYIDNPFCSLMFAYNTFQEGFNRVYREFNGLRELKDRADASTKLLEFYKNMRVDGYAVGWEPSEKGEFTFKFIYIEILLSQPEIMKQLKNEGIKNLINELIKKFEEKVEHVTEHSIVGLSYTAYAIAQILNQNEKLTTLEVPVDEDMQSFLKTGRMSNNNMLDIILQKARTTTKIKN